ncbi:hypothetical protein [Magnetospirillum sp. UT-4]|uniref:hypothetical protein n=1 Tax=Magnetospirillum sp. UT-4 TaxID=2681467 RepID=UPI0020C211FF|nr:hypothetical protein [Magnetospirillum sp. UT-4]
MKQGRWVTESARDKEAEARQLAEKFLSNKACEGARVVRNWLNRDGSMSENVIFEKVQDARGEGPIRIDPIGKAPPRCEKPRDFFGLESRMAMNRVFRTYFEKVVLTPTELLHNRKEMQRIMDKDALVPSAVDKVATLQVKDTEMPAKQRREEIFAALDQIQAQARRADGFQLPKLGERFSDTLADVAGYRDETPEYLAMVVLSRELIGTRSWLGKLERLCKLAANEPNPQAVLLLDTVIADVLGANVAQEIMGWQRSLADAIIAMLDLADGKFDAAKSEAKDITEQLNALLAAGRLPGSQYVLIDRALKQLRSPQPLYTNEPGKEMEEYQKVLMRLLVPGGILAGEKAAEALTVRGARFVEQGGATGRRMAITNTVQALPDRAHGVMYLAELSKTDFAKDHLDDIREQLDTVFGARVIGELCRRSLSPKERMVSVTGAFKAAKNSALPDELKEKVAAHIDGVLERYIIDEKIIEKLDHPETHLRDRAVRLVKFCGAGVLPEGKALARARKRVVELLRQPNFDATLVDDIPDPARKAKALRDFHQLLVKAGFA